MGPYHPYRVLTYSGNDSGRSWGLALSLLDPFRLWCDLTSFVMSRQVGICAIPLKTLPPLSLPDMIRDGVMGRCGWKRGNLRCYHHKSRCSSGSSATVALTYIDSGQTSEANISVTSRPILTRL